MRIAIIGGNLTGLALAHMFLDSDHSVDITVIEERAEIGFPCKSPGILYDSNHWLSHLQGWGISIQEVGHSLDDGSVSFRRAWLEKDLSLSLVEKGASILLRTRVEENGKVSLRLQGAGGSTHWEGDFIIKIPEHEPGNNSWTGMVTSQEVSGGWPRDDGTWETWIENPSQIATEYKKTSDSDTFLEVMETNFSSFESSTIDGSLIRAVILFDELSNLF
jgi:hypothetical protein